MSQWVGVGLFVLAILVVVLVHEGGHFFTAKAFRIKVEEFFVGFGPRIWSIRRGDTEYGLKALPLGGYVRIAGMNPFQEPASEDLPRTFGAKPVWQRAIVIFAGPVTHFFIAIVLFFVFFVLIGTPVRFQPLIGAVCPLNERSAQDCPTTGRPSPAQQAGLEPGDAVVALDGRPVRSTEQFIAYTRAHVDQPIRITVERGPRRVTLTATPELSTVGNEQVGRLGVVLTAGKVLERDRTGPITGAARSVSQTGSLVKSIVVRLGDVFGPTGLQRIGELLVGSEPRRSTDPTSLVGGARLAGEAAQAGAWDAMFELLIVFNVFVGILNLVPLPPLDGGHLAILAYEKIRRRKPDVRKLVPLTALVAGFMILLVMSLAYIDITKPLPNPFR